jgi:hypothetical protein
MSTSQPAAHDEETGMAELQGTSYDEWIVGCADPEATAAGLVWPGRP